MLVKKNRDLYNFTKFVMNTLNLISFEHCFYRALQYLQPQQKKFTTMCLRLND